MMYPNREGDPLPVSEWSAIKTSVKNTIGEEGSLITFNHLEDVSGINVQHANDTGFSILQPTHQEVSSTTPTIDWEDVDGADAYQVFLWESPGVNAPPTPVATVTESQWTPPPLSHGTGYRLQIAAVNAAGAGYSVRRDFQTISAGLAHYQVWAANHGGAPNPQLDNNTNGMPDLLDYFLGARLNQQQTIPPPTRDGTGRLIWRIPHDPAAQVAWGVERSETLASLTSVSDWEPMGQVRASMENIGGQLHLALDLGEPLGVAGSRLFYRLRVTMPE